MHGPRWFRVALVGLAVVAVVAGAALSVLKVLGVTGPALVVVGVISAVAAATPKAWEPISKMLDSAAADKDRLATALVPEYDHPVPLGEVDPYRIGVFRSHLASDSAALEAGPDPYVPRRGIDDRLSVVLREPSLEVTQRLVVVRGDPKTGKSRTLWQGLRTHLGDRRLLALRVPSRDEDDQAAGKPLKALLDLERPLSKTGGADLVVWIDDAQRHYQRGFTAANLRRLITRYPHIVVAATLHNSALEQIKDFDPPLEAMLRRASEGLMLEPVLTNTELDDARRLYPGVADHKNLDRLPELFAGVDLLIDLYRDNTASESVGVAVAAAVIAWQRAGMPPGTLTKALLREITTHTLARIAPQRDLDDDNFADGLTWARKEVAAEVALVSRTVAADGTARYQPFDAVVAWAARRGDPIPNTAWNLAIDNADPAGLISVGTAAYYQSPSETNIARLAFEHAIDSHHPDAAPMAMFNLGAMLNQQEDFAGARAAFELAIDSHHPDAAPMAAVNLGFLLNQQEDFAGARRAFELAIDSRHPDQAPMAAVNLGLLLEEQEDFAGARRAFELAIDSRHPDQAPKAAFNLGVLLGKQEDFAGARRAFQLAIDSRHSDAAPRAAFSLGVLLNQQKDFAGARAAYQLAIDSRHPDDAPSAAVNLGGLLEQQEDFAGARAAYQQAIDSRHPDHAPSAAFDLGVLLGKQEDFAGARAAYQQAIDSRHPDHAPKAAFNLGRLLLNQQKDFAGARAAYQQAIDSHDPDAAPKAAVNLGNLLNQQKDFEGARAAYQLAVDSRHPEAAPKASSLLRELLDSQR